MKDKYLIDKIENKEFLDEIKNRLLEFGIKFPSEKGSSYYLGDTGLPMVEKPRYTWITCRMAHVYSIGKMIADSSYEKLAEAAINGLNNELLDKINGGWYAGIDSNDEILPDKQCYAHAFVILAGTSGVIANIKGADELLAKALKVYEEKFWDEKEELAFDTYTTDFVFLSDYRGLNANMHSVEAFLAVYDALGDEKYRIRAGKIIDRVIEWAKNNGWRIPEHFSKDWEPDLNCNIDNPADQFKPFGATPGHGIEWGRLICQWALSTYNNDIDNAKKYIEAAEKLYCRAIDDAWCADGEPGIVYTTDWDGKAVVHDRMHWTLAEAINTSAVLYRVTSKDRYYDDYAKFMKYLDEKVYDKETGSWFHQLDEKNNLSTTVWPGKSDLYHAFQATLIPYSKVSVSIAKSTSEM